MPTKYIDEIINFENNSMKIANADIQFFQSYTKSSSKNIAHKNTKREFWLKKTAPETTTTTNGVQDPSNVQPNKKCPRNKNKPNTILKTPSFLSQTNPSNRPREPKSEKIPSSKIEVLPVVPKTHLGKFNYYSPLTNQFTRSMVQPYLEEQKLSTIEGRMSIQQVLTKQRNEAPANDCITPPLPPADGTWKTIHETNVVRVETAPSDDIPATFPKVFPALSKMRANSQPPKSSKVTTVGVTVTIKTYNKMLVDEEKFILAMLQSIQMIDQRASLAPYEYLHDQPTDVTTDNIYSVKDLTEKDRTTYIEHPIQKLGSQEYSARLVFNTTMPMMHILFEKSVKDWFRQE